MNQFGTTYRCATQDLSALEAGKRDGLSATLPTNIELRPPRIIKLFAGRDRVAHVLSLVAGAADDFGFAHRLEFCGLHVNDGALIGSIVVMMRPLSALESFSEKMAVAS